MLIRLYEQAKKLMGIDRYLVYSSSRLEKQFEEIVRIARLKRDANSTKAVEVELISKKYL